MSARPNARTPDRLAAALVVLVMTAATACATSSPMTQVLIVRHAEKAADGTRDPELSDLGRARAAALAAVLRDAAIDAVYATPYQRTQATARPFADARRLSVEVVDAGAIDALVADIRARHRGRRVLVVAHSNTVPEIVQALGGDRIDEIDEGTFDDLYVVTVPDHGPTTVLHLKYATPAPTAPGQP